MHRRSGLVLVVLGLSVLTLPLAAKPPEERGHGRGERHGRGEGHGKGQGGGRGRGDRPSFGSGEAALIQGWLSANPAHAGQPLPPGMRNRLARGKPLPPGIARRSLPPDLLVRLPRHPGFEYLALGATVVLVETATGLVRETLYDVLLPR